MDRVEASGAKERRHAREFAGVPSQTFCFRVSATGVEVSMVEE